MQYLEGLNQMQKEAVLQTDGPVLIVAGAGAGKTKTITHRIMHLIEKGVSPENILAITFTNKAGKEMKERILNELHKNKELFLKNHKKIPFISTFHSLGVYIIRENAEKIGLSRNFNILDKTDSKKMLKNILEDLGFEPKEYLDKVSNIISNEKNRGNSLEDFLERQSFDISSDLSKKVWQRHESLKKKEKCLDFDDLLSKSLEILEKFKEVREYYQNLWKYIHIDEYQDTNKVQNAIAEALAEKYKNICVVGDTDQNIYSWRGADIKNMLHFEKKYPDTKLIMLEENYRSTKTILNVANEIIKKNNFRIPKNLFTSNKDGEKISIYESFNETDEAHFIANKCKSIIESGVKPSEIAILYRANFQSRILEEAMLSYSVPYQMIGTKFFERKEVKDVLAYIKTSLNTENKSDFLRIINTPPRGIGKTTIDKIKEGREEDLPEKTKEKIDIFKKTLVKINDFIKENKVSDSLKFIIEISGIKKSLEESKKEEDLERLENVMELVTLSKNYDGVLGLEAMEMFLTDTSLFTDEEEMKEDREGVKLMTIHASKGLEFEYVFITGLEMDLFPHKRFGEKMSKEDGEEERRLFYVAITRAKEKLYLTHTTSRTIFGERKINIPSEFLSDIDEDYVEYEKKSMLGGFGEAKSYFSIDF